MPSKHILLIGQDKKFIAETAEFLQFNHYRVDVAYSGADALRRLNHAPDLVLIDYILPDIKAAEICRKMKSDERWQDVPLVISVDHNISSEETKELYAYSNDHIIKPYDREELLSRIAVLLRYSQMIKETAREEHNLIVELKKIWQQGLIAPFFQPIYSVPSFKIFGVEALTRPVTESSLKNPELFFKAALEFGIYGEVEKMAWHKAFLQWEESLGQGKLFLNGTPYFISHNLMDSNFFEALNISSRDIVIELTERTAIRNHEAFMHKLDGLRKLGAQIAVDDVGSGFASLNTVAEVKPDYVKIDLRLIRHINTDMLRKNIVGSIITFCQQSGIGTIAEGIEDHDELRVVCELGVDAVQGYLLGKPSPEINKAMFLRGPIL